MQRIHLFFNIFQRNTAHPAYRSRKIGINDTSVNSDRLKDLGTLIGLDRGNPHLGSDLHNAVKHRPIVIVYRRIIILIQHMVFDQFLHTLLRQIGIYRTGTKAEQCCKMMHLSGLRRLQYHRHTGTLFRLHQMLIQRRYRQQGRDRHMVLIHAPVRQDQNVHAFPELPVRLHKEPVYRLFQTGVLIINDRHNTHLKPLVVHIFDLQNIRIGQDRILHLQHRTVIRLFLQQISILTDIDRGGSHNFLTDRIDRRICHLGKQLFKRIKQRMVG